MPSPQPDDPRVELEAIRGRAARQETDPYPCYDFIAKDAIALASRLLEERDRFQAALKKSCDSEVAARKVIETSAAYIAQLEYELSVKRAEAATIEEDV